MKIKQPSETITLAVPFGVALASITSVVIEARGLVAGAALVAGTAAIAASNVTVDVSGGTDGERYLLTVKAMSAAGQPVEAELELAVIDFGWAVPTLMTPYLTAAQFVERLGIEDTIRLTDAAGNGRIDKARLADALVDASAQADAYLATRYTVPLSTVPAIVTTIVFDLAVCRLWRGELPGDVAAKAATATKMLGDLGKGVVALPGAAAITPAPGSPVPVLVSGPDRMFSRDRLSGL